MNKNKLKYLCSLVSKKFDIDYNSIRKLFYLEEILKRIAKSKYRNNFIFKGGMLFSNIIGIENRRTVDIDFSLKGIESNEKNLKIVFNEILLIKNDEINFIFNDIQPIKTDLNYPCYRFKFRASLENEKEDIVLDIGVGDKIFPKPIEYSYKSFFKDESFQVLSYTLETYFSEKLFAIISKGEANTRLKDYYDLHFLILNCKKMIDKSNLGKAISITFDNRNEKFDIKTAKLKLLELSNFELLDNKWKKYLIKNEFTLNITFKNLVLMIVEFLTEIFE
ncbi:nucleotidyl transferase AbiEii/AbiGii toxin family protein [Mycoplasmopsis fermentans]|uniref:Abortive infection protein AbiGII n=2 Tax=Mycoplasmopsis fermentans TaxID=2115 RepID=C4XEI2_MYCFP|nr:nucleotidyl transferase AbiEii/AbiGii toxin family protein [Mycoplasmopsis fermentans]VEU67423.1 Nucleotidyl transferase of uncharacterised function (DUF1814) [Mesomycoplasma conjunctivae]ADN68812.1 hypothetical abortive infection protein AbiGII [Mycoplasmopsis fermentans JER]ADV34256.1 Abortive infection protein AbiGII [Mycoplasmopsis fermentans M64]VEU60282.1 Nucleotidyl transferase of uncharacterised function (DUF1814) [Mycoplasmopsis fermentans]BAH69554.1 hypothetical protein MBIO_0289 